MVEGIFIEGLKLLGLDTQDDRILEQFSLYRKELLEWNTRVNLTAITDPQDVLVKHFLDSLSLLTVYDQTTAHFLDIGSGAGFPGIPLKIARPQWHVTLLEATGKRVAFLRHMVETLQLEHTWVVQGRAEELAHMSMYRGCFDIVTARAVASLPTLLEYCAPYCRVGGSIILPKKGDLAEELERGEKAAAQLGSVFKTDSPVNLPGLSDGRRLLTWEQRKPCPVRFPRHGSIIVKRPLG